MSWLRDELAELWADIKEEWRFFLLVVSLCTIGLAGIVVLVTMAPE